MPRWELTDEGDGPAMFWEVGSDGAVVTVRHGEAGAPGRTRVDDHGSAAAAEAYVAEAVREKEREGYAPAGPDEDSFTLPVAWRQRLRPRWGGIARHSHAPHESVLGSWDRRLAAVKEEWTGTVLPGIAPEPAAAARRQLEGTADPLGAAVLAVVTDRGKLLYDAVADAWQLRHGRVFAARATVELFRLDHEDDHGRTTRLAFLPEGDSSPRLWLRRGAADRVRTLLSMADEDHYREVVAALAAHRGDARRRIVVSYLVPAETGWVAECCADPGTSGREDRVVRAMLFESLNDQEQLRALLRAGGVSAYDGSLSTAATVAEGVGPAVAALIAEIWRHRTPSHGASAEEQAGILAELPTDEAFELLMAHADGRQVRPALLEAVRRYPVRAARLLAGRAAPAPDRNAFLLGQLLTAHVATHRELLESRLARFPPKAAEVVRGLLYPSAADAPADALPELLVSPPWTGRRTAPKPTVVKGLVAGEETRVRWRPGEREAWAAAVEEPERRARRRQNEPYPDVRTLREHFTDVNDHRLAALFADGPDTYRPLLARWTPGHMWRLVEELKPVAARWEEDALPPLLHAAARRPAVAGGLLLPYRQVEVARLMADWFVRLKSVAATTRAWFARHGADAAALLVPDAA
ncbi:WGR domain-containing protein, partial [Actinoallomurus acaciae]